MTSRSEHAGLVTRLAALAVDAAILAVLVPSVGAGGPALWGAVTGHAPDWLHVCAGVAAALTPFAYFWLGWASLGRGVGGLLFGATVTRTGGRPLGPARAMVRTVVGIFGAPFWLAGMALIPFDRQRRALHDVLLHTVVLRSQRDPVAPGARRPGR